MISSTSVPSVRFVFMAPSVADRAQAPVKRCDASRSQRSITENVCARVVTFPAVSEAATMSL